MTHHNTPNTSNRNTPNTSQAKQMDKTLYANERAHWKQQFEKEPYYESGHAFSDYDPAYRVGAEARERYAGKRFEQIESNLQNEWEEAKGSARIGWDKAKQAVRAAWDRVEHAMPGDDDRKQRN